MKRKSLLARFVAALSLAGWVPPAVLAAAEAPAATSAAAAPSSAAPTPPPCPTCPSLYGNRFFFKGAELDPDTGLYYMRGRWYDPRLGRFLSPDPMGYVDGPNRYAAFRADPINYRDPMGTKAIKVTPEGATDLSDAAEWAILDAAGLPDWYKYSVIQQYSHEWPTVRGRAQLMLSGYMAEAGLRHAGKMWLIGAGGIATGGLGAWGLGAAGVTGTTWGGTLLLGAGTGGAGNMGALATSNLIDWRPSPASDYLWSAGTGALIGGPFALGARALGGTGPAIVPPVVDPVYSGGRLRVLNPHFAPLPAAVLQNLTDTEAAVLAANPALAGNVLSMAELRAARTYPGVARMQYGNAVERMVRQTIEESPLHRSLYEGLGGPRNPDFTGLGPAAGMNFDITTPGQVGAHLARPGYGPGLNVITYQRPPGFRTFP